MTVTYPLFAAVLAHFSEIWQANRGCTGILPNSLLESCFEFQPNLRGIPATGPKSCTGEHGCARKYSLGRRAPQSSSPAPLGEANTELPRGDEWKGNEGKRAPESNSAVEPPGFGSTAVQSDGQHMVPMSPAQGPEFASSSPTVFPTRLSGLSVMSDQCCRCIIVHDTSVLLPAPPVKGLACGKNAGFVLAGVTPAGAPFPFREGGVRRAKKNDRGHP